ncbi:hypothetical protein F3Y22_tig00110885pilonHSYRG00074 [Hibiscus syriacus]|uniref:Myosin-related n=1 Tax=Hibiscus syriacus TaxID=106335 RepID=A0A6A2ZL83_HIBSY|nr:trichohyalin-like isoform X2 [Hibiscus syriacus]KAE8691685.1 hypothetical protein F3Y22_tig00110885pilonHSYRG00074 [Hibiscus syriacus]
MERVSMGTTITRRAKWQYPPAQPSPRIIHLPRRLRRKAPKASPSKLPGSQKERKGMVLESLFDQGGSFTRGSVPVVVVSPRESDDEMRRGRVAEEEEEKRENRSSSVAFVEEEKWRFQAEMLRAECNLLRMERKIAVKKMERRKVYMERTLKSAAQILLSGRKNICERKDVNMALLDEQINELIEKIEKLQKRSGVQDLEVKKCSNFDKKISSLQRQLEKSGFKGISDEERCVKEIRQMAEASLSIKTISEDDDHNRNVQNYSDLQVESLRRKMDGLSKGFLLEEYSDLSSSSLQQSCKEKMSHEARVCSGHCKALVQRVVEQIRAETEQWSQMQDMLGLVRDEMEELHASRDFWEDRALDSDYRIRSLQSAVKEWRQKALSSEAEAKELRAQVYVLRQEVERLRQERERKTARTRIASPINREAQSETEKRVLVCRLKEDDPCTAGLIPIRRSPLRDISNKPTLKKQQKQHGEGILPLFSLHKEEMKRSS